MIILPAIDILGGKCVMLTQGEYDKVSKVAESPVETAKYFADCGAEYIHMVDLDGAKEGSPKNAEVFIEVAKNVDVPIELGGGIRTMETVDYYIENGISRVILGSVILQNKEFAEKAILKYGDKIAVGIDMKNRKVKTSYQPPRLPCLQNCRLLVQWAVALAVFQSNFTNG
jgi:phosphoribosylformimino-5-aminoimidazole carboxamide ribotide isomerase